MPDIYVASGESVLSDQMMGLDRRLKERESISRNTFVVMVMVTAKVLPLLAPITPAT